MVERINGVIADVLRSFAGERADDLPGLMPLVEFEINASATPPSLRPGPPGPLRSGYTAELDASRRDESKTLLSGHVLSPVRFPASTVTVTV